ncbi:MAG: hypothetical protein LRY76_06780, partial [Alphaproteobacteria bacterium]|nr:hypothetical protein [Alphaproteobacteria bacterium]
GYTISWNGFKPIVQFAVAPANNISIKLLSYSVGGSANTVGELYRKNITGNVFDMETKIDYDSKVVALINGALLWRIGRSMVLHT